MKRFNTTGVCIPEKHYMVDITDRVSEIKKLVDAGDYFVINRARQYGKTTTLTALKKKLSDDYVVVGLDFQGISKSGFSTEQDFVQDFCRLIIKKKRTISFIPDEDEKLIREFMNQDNPTKKLSELFGVLNDWCEQSSNPVILVIDEVDSATNNQVFIDFLAQMRDGYISRDADGIPTFQSVILAGVTDVKHLKSKIRDDEDAKVNSPWNIAADFNIDMSLSEDGIRGMLKEYEKDHHTGMDIGDIAKQIRDYTSGYPFLVSRICQLLDETVSMQLGLENAWTSVGIDEAIKLLLSENNTLFQTLTKNMNNYPNLKDAIRSILMEGKRVVYNLDQNDIIMLDMYGFIRNDHNTVKISNRIFETRLYNLFLSDDELKGDTTFFDEGDMAKNQFVTDGRLNMRLILEKFISTYNEIFGPLEDKFKEKDGRELFLLYIKAIINGTGNYYIEAQTRDQKRTDVIVDYLGQRYIIEMKIWHGERYNAEGEKQISEYLDYFGLDTGYMLSFNFNKNKETGVKQVHVGDKVLYEGTV